MARTTKKIEDVKTGPSDFTILMNWIKDNNLNSPFPVQLETSRAISPVFFLMYFLGHPQYWIWINNIFNNTGIFYLNNKDIYKTFKEIYYYTRYNSFSKKKTEAKQNPLIKLLKLKFPYYKNEEILMAVNIIDNSDDKDVIYEMFELNNGSKVKKMTKKELKDRDEKVKNLVTKDDILSMM